MDAIREEQTNYGAKCEKCKQSFHITEKDLSLVARKADYTLFSYECPFCGAIDYVKDGTLPFKTS